MIPLHDFYIIVGEGGHRMLHFCSLALLVVAVVNADVYLHFPPGSNNRVNENTANRKNAQNAFDSQNNNKGGYNVPDATDQPYGNNASLQYYLVSFVRTEIEPFSMRRIPSRSNRFRFFPHRHSAQRARISSRTTQ